jgi:hypothetical protein
MAVITVTIRSLQIPVGRTVLIGVAAIHPEGAIIIGTTSIPAQTIAAFHITVVPG